MLVHTPRLWIAMVVVALLPLTYALIYLTSVWDTNSHLRALTVAVVNLDGGMNVDGQKINVGERVTNKLEQSSRFDFVYLHSPETARLGVRKGQYAFALIIPEDFSYNAISGYNPGEGRLIVYSSDGNQYQTALVARQFATELGHEINENLNAQRWFIVLNKAAGSEHSVEELHQAVTRLRDGAIQLELGTRQASTASQALTSGATKFDNGVDQLVDGMRQLGSGLRTMDSKRPTNSDLNKLRNGADRLAAGHIELGNGLSNLHHAGIAIQDGVQQYRAELADSFFAPEALKTGSDQLYTSLNDLNKGILAARDGQRQLSEGADKLATSVTTLTTGVQALSSGIHTATSKLPEDTQLEELQSGGNKLVDGSKALSSGLSKLATGQQELVKGLSALQLSLPQTIDKPSGSPEGMADPVRPIIESVAQVANSGHGMAPNILPAALWLGASIAVFLINLKLQPRFARHYPALIQLLGKLCLPMTLVVVQSVLLYGAALWVLHFQIAHREAFLATLVVSSWSFLCVVAMLSKLLGDAGKALSMVFLAIQLSSSGGVIPVELSGGWYSIISPWLPMTWVVRAIKASLFDAFDGVWFFPLLMIAAWGLASLAISATLGKWRYVSAHAIHPAVDL